jgi:hypothetical protein
MAHMEPGISSEDCLYADVGIDPGRRGCQHYEASQLLFFDTRINTDAYLVLWQAGLVGDRTHKRFATGPAYRQVLVDVLGRDYPPNHEVIIYRGATLPIRKPRIRRIALQELPATEVSAEETLVLPPCSRPRRNDDILARLDALDKDSLLSG